MTFTKKSALIALCLFTTANVLAEKYTNRTFIAIPTCGAAHSGYAKVRALKNADNDVLNHMKVGGFYSASTNGNKLASSLLVDGTNLLRILGSEAESSSSPFSFLNENFIHNNAADATIASLMGNITLSPSRTVWGMNFGYERTMPYFEKMFFSVNLPVLGVAHDLRATATNTTAVNGATLLQFFEGNYQQTLASTHNLQTALTSAIFGGRKTAAGVASVDVNVGYNLVDEEEVGARIRAFVHFPTGTSVKGKYLFEPRVGNGRHYEIGAAFDTDIQLYHSQCCGLDFYASAAVGYSVEATEYRTVGLRDRRHFVNLFLPQYLLFGAVSSSTDQALIPGANILTMPLSVRPGVSFDACTKLAFHYNKFGVNACYTLGARSSEVVKVKSWTDGVYAVAAVDYSTATAFAADLTKSYGYAYNRSDLDTSVCSVPALVTHKLSGSVSWSPTIRRSECSFAAGAGYQFAPGNYAVEHYDVFAKVGVSF